ncbi:MAG: hypothetical protein R2881_08430 [Eubacteriales bacterium]
MDMNELSKEFGFAACFTFTTEPFEHYEKTPARRHFHWAADDLSTDLSKVAPWANAPVVDLSTPTFSRRCSGFR